ncbi:ornithine cyclodeaminase family protein [Pelomonas sp. APW6]|uniref:Ornithine cyclodeaminase family protein n=1 Tax=Roseateles subflavus TaxID=3053353 RepID=A0ABT7LEV1_9BURK|nr:ornithine cyclodeaminase family protein [Pelomonas sp. APW6]MDL5031379.1 ornithine cyclodeaminase family protein [Pelomonas sp. APW6]
MHVISAEQVDAALDFPALIDALAAGFAAPFEMPARQLLALSPSRSADCLGLLPAWTERLIGLKAFTYLPGNAAQGEPVLHAQVLVFDRRDGRPLAQLEGRSITRWRTAAVSALASRLLSRPDARRLLLLGTGELACPLVQAHLAVRPLEEVRIWGRRPAQAAARVETLRSLGVPAALAVAVDLAAAQPSADLIVAATGAGEPLVFGELVPPGCHVDLLGNHRPDQRECDAALVQRARVYVDSRANALGEAGELILPLQQGLVDLDHILGELADLCRLPHPPQRAPGDVTLFKSVGTALADLLCAQRVLTRLGLLEP